VRRLGWLTEDFAEWDTGVWVHYATEPYLKINPHQSHQDPAGIYLFPEKFDTKGGWRMFPYKFRVTIEGLRDVLDLSKLSEKESIDLYEKLVPERNRELRPEDFRRSDPANVMWDSVRNYFVLGRGRPGVGAWNKALRDLGYDAVFDDTGAIHVLEVQLLVLDPTKVDVIERVDQRSTGFNEMGVVTRYMADLLAPYGKVSVDEPRRRRAGFSPASAITASVRVEKSDDPAVYAVWDIAPVFSGGERTPSRKSTAPREISVHLQYSSPSLSYGAGAYVELGRGDIGDRGALGPMRSMRTEVENAMDRVWKAAGVREPLAASAGPPPGRRLLGLTDEAGAFTDPSGRFWGDAGAGGVFYAESTGRYLVSKRSSHVNEPNTWGTWGGRIERGETPEEALRREVREETGYAGTYDLDLLHTYRDGDFEFRNYLIVVPDEFEPRHSWETSDHRWVEHGDWPEPLHFGMRELIPHIRPRTPRGVRRYTRLSA
jgi:8-oxo-dGTP pyrophosphatase MutT (NUDIX family)